MQPVRTLSFRLGRLPSDGLVDMNSSSRDTLYDGTTAGRHTTQPKHCNTKRYDKIGMVESQHVVVQEPVRMVVKQLPGRASICV